MRPTRSDLCAIFDGMRAGADPIRRAYAENVLFEERLEAARVANYAARLPPGLIDPAAWIAQHNEYIARNVYIELPETFAFSNPLAALSPDRGLHFVRVEDLRWALRHISGLSADRLALAADVLQRRRSVPDLSVAHATVLIEEVCSHFNSSPVRSRPKFAGFFHDLAGEGLDPPAAGWPDRLRDRLGLAHYDPEDGAPIPVALFRYPVGVVLDAAASNAAIAQSVTLPTFLDSNLDAVFHPAPRELEYGRTIDLDHDEECDHLNAEVLHLRIDYVPEHLWAVEAITTRAGVAPPMPVGPDATSLERLRATHLFCLQYGAGRADFGASPGPGTTP